MTTQQMTTIGPANNSASHNTSDSAAINNVTSNSAANNSVVNDRNVATAHQRFSQANPAHLRRPIAPSIAFTPAEDDLLLRGLIHCASEVGGRQWRRIANEFLPCKVPISLKERYEDMTSIAAAADTKFKRYVLCLCDVLDF